MGFGSNWFSQSPRISSDTKFSLWIIFRIPSNINGYPVRQANKENIRYEQSGVLRITEMIKYNLCARR